jgi:hypothetical protein
MCFTVESPTAADRLLTHTVAHRLLLTACLASSLVAVVCHRSSKQTGPSHVCQEQRTEYQQTPLLTNSFSLLCLGPCLCFSFPQVLQADRPQSSLSRAADRLSTNTVASCLRLTACRVPCIFLFSPSFHRSSKQTGPSTQQTRGWCMWIRTGRGNERRRRCRCVCIPQAAVLLHECTATGVSSWLYCRFASGNRQRTLYQN